MRKIWIACLVLGLGFLALSFLPASASSETAEIAIPVGAGSRAIGHILADAGVVKSAAVFRLACFLSGSRSKLKAGDYELPKNLNAWSVARLLVSGKALQHRFLIPEGLAASQIAALLEEKKLASGARFLKLVKSRDFAKKMGIDAPSLEGFLFPDSYQFSKGVPEETLVSMMVLRFHEKVPPTLLAQGAGLNLRPLQVLTLASLIEKEAKSDEDRPKVARVFLNRRRQKKRLESCATVRYALNKYKGPVLFKDLDVDSSFNTYRHYDLPPGPICSPGLKSIEAAAKPAEGDWLFFVVGSDGSHVFSKTFEEHLKAKKRYKRLKKGVVEE